jgi:hypothetical protein
LPRVDNREDERVARASRNVKGRGALRAQREKARKGGGVMTTRRGRLQRCGRDRLKAPWAPTPVAPFVTRQSATVRIEGRRGR